VGELQRVVSAPRRGRADEDGSLRAHPVRSVHARGPRKCRLRRRRARAPRPEVLRSSTGSAPVVDRKCSGRRTCRMVIPDATLHGIHPCPKELMPYLEASYLCVRGTVRHHLLERLQSKPPVRAALVVTYLQFPIQVCFPCGAAPSIDHAHRITDEFLNSLVVLIVV